MAVTPITYEHTVDHVKRLLEKVIELGVRVKLLLLDAGYVEVINYLNANGIKFIMRAHDNGMFRAGNDLIYTTNHHNLPEQATFRVVAFNGKDRLGHTELFIFATNYFKLSQIGRSEGGSSI